MTYEKLYNEIYAVVSLKFLWPEYKPDFIKCESPDWINETMDFGLEVSQALLPAEGQDEKNIDKYLGCLKEELPSQFMEKYGSRLYFYNDRFWAILPNPSLSQDYCAKAEYRFDRKLEKLNTNYKHMRYNGLYLYLHTQGNTTIDAGQLFENIQHRQEKQKYGFDWVFLNCVKTIYVCDYIKNIINPIDLPQNAEGFLSSETEFLRYCCDWEDGTSIENAATRFPYDFRYN